MGPQNLHGTLGQPEHRSPDQCEKNAFSIMSLGPAPSAALGEPGEASVASFHQHRDNP